MTQPNPSAVAIGFSTTDALISRAIRGFLPHPGLKSEEIPSHTWVLHEAYGGLFVMQAEWSGFQTISWEYFKTKNRIIQIISVGDRLTAMGIDPIARVNWLAGELGDGYDFFGYLRFIVPKLIKGQSPKKLLCSEAVVRFAEQLFPGTDPETASPPAMLVQLRSATA